MGLVNLTKDQIQKIQIDEGIVVKNYGESDQAIIGPTRGGAELTITPSIRDIEYDGRKGSTKGMQVKDGEEAVLKVTSLCCSQEMLALALPGATVGTDESKTITPSDFGLIPESAYLKNIAIVTKMLDNTFKILKISNPLHQGAFGFKTASKSENEHNLELTAHYDPIDDTVKLYNILESATNPLVKTQNASAQE